MLGQLVYFDVLLIEIDNLSLLYNMMVNTKDVNS